MVILEVTDDDPIEEINTPPMVWALLFASATPISAYNSSDEIKIRLRGVEEYILDGSWSDQEDRGKHSSELSDVGGSGHIKILGLSPGQFIRLLANTAL